MSSDIMVLICISLLISDVEHLYMYLLSIQMSSPEKKKIAIYFFDSFWIRLLFFLTLDLYLFLYFGYNSCLIDVCKNILPFCRSSSHFVSCFFLCEESFKLNEIPFIEFASVVCAFNLIPKNSVKTHFKRLLPYIFFWEFYGIRS